MEVFFNELCLNEKTEIRYQDIKRLRELHLRLRDYDIRGCRISHKEYGEVIQQARTMPGTNPNVVNFLFAFLRQPYETVDVDKRQDEYLGYSWAYQGTPCYGLALAYIMESMAVSICDPAWKVSVISITKDCSFAKVRNLFDEETFLFHQKWLDGLQPVTLEKCPYSPEAKQIKLRDDHGKDKLLVFCKKLVNSDYVCEIINSIPFNAGNRRFIHRIRKDGIIELVLPWTDEGYGVAVKTTGRNLRETEKIAEILKEKYGFV